MSGMNFTKEEVIQACGNSLSERKKEAQQLIEEISEAVNSEAKSSVGDKHETGRARMQAEQERLQNQLREVNLLEEQFDKLKRIKTAGVVSLGSLVCSDKGVFFVALALGKVQVAEQPVHVISSHSPLAIKMLGLKQGESFEMNGVQYSIQQLA
jgi:transcription elongation GreA/GreB family factor